MEKVKRKKCESWFYRPLWHIAKLFGAFYVSKNKMVFHPYEGKIEEPAIILGNHGSFFDWYYMISCLNGVFPHFVMSRYYLTDHWYAKFLRAGGVVGKSVFASDSQSAISLVRILKQGKSIALFPEARLSASHKAELIPPDTAAFVKRLGLPVYAVISEGATFMMPKWHSKTKGARVETHVEKLFEGKELDSLSLEEVQVIIDKALYFDDFKYLEQHPEVEVETDAVGAEKVLIWCPKCHKEYTIKTHDKTLTCSSCGFEVKMDGRFHYTPSTLVKNEGEWFEKQRLFYRDQVLANPNYSLESKVKIRYLKDYVGEGVCKLDRTGFSFKGTEKGEKLEFKFPLSEFFIFPFKAGDNFVIFVGKRCYIFCPENSNETIKFNIISDILQKEIRGLLT